MWLVSTPTDIATERLHVRKFPLHLEQTKMSDVTVTNEADAVRQAARWADALLAKFYHGPRDNVDAAMHRAEAAYGIPAGTFWSLRYRPPKLMGVAAWFHIKAIYDA